MQYHTDQIKPSIKRVYKYKYECHEWKPAILDGQFYNKKQKSDRYTYCMYECKTNKIHDIL